MGRSHWKCFISNSDQSCYSPRRYFCTYIPVSVSFCCGIVCSHDISTARSPSLYFIYSFSGHSCLFHQSMAIIHTSSQRIRMEIGCLFLVGPIPCLCLYGNRFVYTFQVGVAAMNMQYFNCSPFYIHSYCICLLFKARYPDFHQTPYFYPPFRIGEGFEI